jgi:cytochrome c551/c552
MQNFKLIITGFLLLAVFNTYADNSTLPEGEKIFTSRCASCHNVNKQLTGPALANVHERRSLDWIYTFIHSPGGKIRSGDKDAVALYNQFNQIIMPDHGDLTKDQINSILDYIKAETKIIDASAKAPFARPGELQPTYSPLSLNDTTYIVAYLLAVGLLVGVLLLAAWAKEYERKMRAEK